MLICRWKKSLCIVYTVSYAARYIKYRAKNKISNKVQITLHGVKEDLKRGIVSRKKQTIKNIYCLKSDFIEDKIIININETSI